MAQDRFQAGFCAFNRHLPTVTEQGYTMQAWITSFTGRRLHYTNLQPEDVVPEDIAHHLALLNRFAGATREPYSVAQHSVLVSLHCPNYPLYGLLHDAHEYMVVDVPGPLKQMFLGQYGSVTSHIQFRIHQRFGLKELDDKILAEINKADGMMLRTEARDLLITQGADWESSKGLAAPEPVVPWSWEDAERFWLKRLHELWTEAK